MVATLLRHRLLTGLISATIAVGLAWWILRDLLRDNAFLSPAQIERLATRGTLILVSLEPELNRAREPATDAVRWHGWLELGRTPIADAAIRREILESLHSDLVASNDEPIPACFSPRHGLQWRDGDTELDVVICYHCRQFEVFPSPTSAYGILRRTASESVFDRMLTKAGVPLAAKGPEESD